MTTLPTLPTVEITYSRRRLVGLTAIGVVISAVLVGGALAGPPVLVLRILFALLAVIAVLATVVNARNAVRAHHAVIILTATGVSDSRVALREIPWLDVIDVRDYRPGQEKYVALIVEESVWDACEVRTAQRRARGINRSMNVDGLFLNALPTTATHDDLLASVLRYWQTARSATTR